MGAILPRVTRDNVEALSELLGRIGGDEVAEALLELLGRADPTPSPATSAMLRALGRSGSDRALRALLERLTTPTASWARTARPGALAAR
ncbi:MAG: HEAT repeat domain-containing protein [Deltaproteobacteria bacterium]|nr:HEAT repeat domain-containing protein [Deltaproteobacteria bacterium]